MTNNKQQTAVEWLWEIAYNRELTVEDWKQAKEMEKQQRSIELPSDEEIEKKAPYSTLGWGYEFGMNDGFKKGAKFVIDKIQGGDR